MLTFNIPMLAHHIRPSYESTASKGKNISNQLIIGHFAAKPCAIITCSFVMLTFVYNK